MTWGLPLVAAVVLTAALAALAALEDAADRTVDTAKRLLADIVNTVDKAVERVADCVLGTLRECGRNGVRCVQARVGNVARSADNAADGAVECGEDTTAITAVAASVLACVPAVVATCGHCF